jgi:hypothetical protein
VNTLTISDPELLAKLAAAPGFLEIRDPAGRVLGTFFLDGYGVPPPGVKSPISDAEFEEARKQTGGKPLSEILKRLQAGEGK